MLNHEQRIALLGTINRDTIYTADGVTTESYGGLLYSILALAEIASSQVAIYPICNVGADMEAIVRKKTRAISTCQIRWYSICIDQKSPLLFGLRRKRAQTRNPAQRCPANLFFPNRTIFRLRCNML